MFEPVETRTTIVFRYNSVKYRLVRPHGPDGEERFDVVENYTGRWEPVDVAHELRPEVATPEKLREVLNEHMTV